MFSLIGENTVLSVVVPFLACLALSALLAFIGTKQEQQMIKRETGQGLGKTNTVNKTPFSYLEDYRKQMKNK